jgi:hypothetical protein
LFKKSTTSAERIGDIQQGEIANAFCRATMFIFLKMSMHVIEI